jgi:hypothetical protein
MGLVPLGHRAGIAENEFASGSTNVVLGFQMLAEAMLDTLPPAASRSSATSCPVAPRKARRSDHAQAWHPRDSVARTRWQESRRQIDGSRKRP